MSPRLEPSPARKQARTDPHRLPERKGMVLLQTELQNNVHRSPRHPRRAWQRYLAIRDTTSATSQSSATEASPCPRQ